MNKKYHKRIQLDKVIYENTDLICSITICTIDKKPILKHKDFVGQILTLLKARADFNNIPIYAYCIMPDHIHLLLSASEKIGIIEFVAEIKSLSTRLAWTFGIEGAIWQKSFYDHFLRKEEDIVKAAQYIFNNPVRKGIVSEWKEYEFCGSLMFEL